MFVTSRQQSWLHQQGQRVGLLFGRPHQIWFPKHSHDMPAKTELDHPLSMACSMQLFPSPDVLFTHIYDMTERSGGYRSANDISTTRSAASSVG